MLTYPTVCYSKELYHKRIFLLIQPSVLLSFPLSPLSLAAFFSPASVSLFFLLFQVLFSSEVWMSIFYTIPEVVGTKPFVFLCLLLEKQGGGEIDKTRPHFAINILVIPSGSSSILNRQTWEWYRPSLLIVTNQNNQIYFVKVRSCLIGLIPNVMFSILEKKTLSSWLLQYL